MSIRFHSKNDMIAQSCSLLLFPDYTLTPSDLQEPHHPWPSGRPASSHNRRSSAFASTLLSPHLSTPAAKRPATPSSVPCHIIPSLQQQAHPPHPYLQPRGPARSRAQATPVRRTRAAGCACLRGTAAEHPRGGHADSPRSRHRGRGWSAGTDLHIFSLLVHLSHPCWACP